MRATAVGNQWQSKAGLPHVAAFLRGASVVQGVLDVVDREAMAKFLHKVDAATPVECVSGCAGPPWLARP